MSPDRPGTHTHDMRRIGPSEGGDGSRLPLVFSRAAITALDRAATAELGIPSLLLMEHASLGVARRARSLMGDLPPGDAGALVLCGTGNNAGDGFAVARHLHLDGEEGRVVVARPPETYTGDAAVNLGIVQRLGILVDVVDEGDSEGTVLRAAETFFERGGAWCVVDALLGTGVRGAPRTPLDGMIRGANRLGGGGGDGVPVLAVDIPSGLDADTGRPAEDGEVVTATMTVTFEGLKRGFLSIDAQMYLGEVCVESIGVPRWFAARFADTEIKPVRRGMDAHECAERRSSRAMFGERERGRRGSADDARG